MMDSQALQSLPLSVRKQILSLVETTDAPGAAEAIPCPSEDSDTLPARPKQPTSRESLREKIQCSLLRGRQLCVHGGWLEGDELRNARKDAERLLEASGRPAGMMSGGSAAFAASSSGRSTKWKDVQVRGDSMLWLPSEPMQQQQQKEQQEKQQKEQQQQQQKEQQQQQQQQHQQQQQKEQQEQQQKEEQQEQQQKQQQQQHREEHSGEGDKSEALGALTDSLRSLREALLSAGVNVGGRMSFQLASYQGRGERYVRHRDRSESCPLRRVTAIVYLNPEWDAQVDGGQLLVYSGKRLARAEQQQQQQHEEEDEEEAAERARAVAPRGGSIVVFDSGLEHEVLPCFAPRVALTAWFSCTEGPAAAHGLLLPSKGAEEAAVPRAPSPLASHPSYPTWTGTSLLQYHRGPEASWDNGNSLIFVSVVSFRDPETAWTVRSLFEAAEAPERLRVGIVWQADAAETDDNMKLLEGEPWRPQVWRCLLPSDAAGAGLSPS